MSLLVDLSVFAAAAAACGGTVLWSISKSKVSATVTAAVAKIAPVVAAPVAAVAAVVAPVVEIVAAGNMVAAVVADAKYVWDETKTVAANVEAAVSHEVTKVKASVASDAEAVASSLDAHYNAVKSYLSKHL